MNIREVAGHYIRYYIANSEDTFLWHDVVYINSSLAPQPILTNYIKHTYAA